MLLLFSFAGDNWALSTNITPAAGGLHMCYYHKANDTIQFGAELEGSLRTSECTGTLGYQIDLPNANLVFRGEYQLFISALDESDVSVACIIQY